VNGQTRLSNQWRQSRYDAVGETQLVQFPVNALGEPDVGIELSMSVAAT